METIELQRQFDLTLAEVEDMRDYHGGVYGVSTHRRNKFWDQVYNDLGNEQAMILGREQVTPYEESHNLVTNVGLAYLLEVGLHTTTDITTWYLSLSDEAGDTPAAGNTSADIGNGTAATISEIDTASVTETIRQTWTGGTATGTTTKTVANGTPVQYTCNTTGFTAYGAFLIGGGTSAFQNATGTLYSWSLFASSKTLATTDTIDVTYSFTATDV